VDNRSAQGGIGATHARVTVEPLDPTTADPADVAAFRAAKVAATALDQPDVPEQSEAEFRRWLAKPSPHDPGLFRVARTGGTVVGASFLLLPEKDNRDTVLFWSWVHPDRRRAGAGRQLLSDAVEVARATGRHLLLTGTIEGTAGALFADRYGFPVAQREVISRLDLSTVDRALLAATVAADHQGYRLQHWRGAIPEEWVERYAAAQMGMRDAPLGDLQYELPTYTPERVRELERFLDARGREARNTVAVHEESGEIAGLTLVLVPREPNGRAYQDDTTVARQHRGHGLGLWMKADMTLRLLAEHPELRDVITGNADDNSHMRRINTVLGFTVTQVSEERQAPVDDVAKLIGG
jgi:mycothiol synthase